nr:MAG TPA: Structural protein [Caudoviricetes sp.]
MAQFGLKYYAQMRSRYKGVFWRVEIAERDYSGASEEMEFSENTPLQITWENRGDEFFVPVKASEATITIMCRENFHYLSLFTSDPRKFRVSIYRNTILYWRGFVVADLYSETFTAPPYEVTIKAVDGFKLLSSVPFLNSDNTQISGKQSLWNILSSCISLLELDVSVSDWMDLYAEGTSESISPLRQVYVNMERFYYVYEEPTFRDALELCLRPFAGQIFQSGGSLHIRRAISLYNNTRPLSFYDVGAEFPSGWLITTDGKTITAASGDALITTMSRDRIDSMWNSDINVLGASTLEIVPAIRKVEVSVKDKMLTNLVEQIGIYDIDLWELNGNSLYLASDNSLELRGDSSHRDDVLYHKGYPVKKTAYRMVFEMKLSTSYHYRSIGGTSSSRPPTSDKVITVRYGFRIVGDTQTYYLDEDGSWQEEEVIIEDDVKTSEGGECKIEIDGFPIFGNCQFFIVQCLTGYSAGRTTAWQTARFTDLSLTLDADEDYDNGLSYALAVNAANNIDMDIQLPISDIPNIPNDLLMNALYFVTSDGKPTRMWHSKGLSDYNPLVNHLMACALKYKQLPAKRISGEMFTGKHIDMNTVVQDDKYLRAGFYINSIELNAMDDTYNSELVEMPQLLQEDVPDSGDDCVLLQSLPFNVSQAVKCVNQIVMLSDTNVLYVFDTITRRMNKVMDCAAGTKLYPADDSYVISDATSLRVIDYRGYTLKYLERDYQTPATFMGSTIYGVARYNIGRGGAISWSYYLGILGKSGKAKVVRGASSESASTSFGTSPSIGRIVKSYASLVVHNAGDAYLFDRRTHKGTLTTCFEGAEILSLSDYFICMKSSGPLKIYRRDTISEQTLVKTISGNISITDNTLAEVAYNNGKAVRIWDYRNNSIRSVINAGASEQAVKGLFFINGNLYILREGGIYKYVNRN